jgi:hypothetical protein
MTAGVLNLEIYNAIATPVIFFFSFNSDIGGVGVQTGSTRHVGHFWPFVSAPGECEDGEFGGMKIWQGKPKYSKKTVS